ncbi:patatin-like phospholipase family protein, partial [Pyxidicoccus sp. 3LFB2]
MLLKERFQINRPLEELELNLVRAVLARPALLDAREEAVLRTALSLARLYKVQHGGLDVGVGALLTPFREEVERRLSPILGGL